VNACRVIVSVPALPTTVVGLLFAVRPVREHAADRSDVPILYARGFYFHTTSRDQPCARLTRSLSHVDNTVRTDRAFRYRLLVVVIAYVTYVGRSRLFRSVSSIVLFSFKPNAVDRFSQVSRRDCVRTGVRVSVQHTIIRVYNLFMKKKKKKKLLLLFRQFFRSFGLVRLYD